MKQYTTFCRLKGQIDCSPHIEHVDAVDLPSAIAVGIRTCAAAWDSHPGDIECFGVAEGWIKILDWEY